MVGVATDNDASGIEVIEPLAALERAAQSAAGIAADQLDEMSMVGWEIIDFRIAAGVAPVQQSQHPKLRARLLVLGTDAATTVVLAIGTRTFQFPLAIGTVVIPFPFVLERGVDLAASVTAGAANVVAYVIGKPE